MSARRGFTSTVAKATVVAVVAAAFVIVGSSPAGAVDIRCRGVLPISAALANSTYSLERDASLRAWGDNYFGQLGNGQNRTVELSPIVVPTIDDMVSVSAGGNHVLGLKRDGTVWAWGINWNGQLGNGMTGFGSESAQPTRVEGLSDVVQVFAGPDNSFAIKRDGTVWAWGRNDDAQLGDGTLVDRLVPIQVPSLTGVAQIAPGSTFTLALLPSGKVLSWGRGASGQLGRGDDVFATYPTPGFVQTSSSTTSHLGGVVAIAASGAFSSHAMALMSNGTVRAWGYNAMGQLGDGTSVDRRYANGTVKGPGGTGSLADVTNISAGGFFSLARTTDGKVWSWGQNQYGELGNSSADLYQKTPIQVSGTTTATATTVAAGGNHSILLRPNGRTHTWGANWEGGIGDDGTDIRWSPYETSVIQELPKKPQNVEAVAGERLAYLTWDAPQSVTTQYVVTPHINGIAQTPIETKHHEAEFAVRDLAEGTAYSFTVEAQNCLGAGTASDQTAKVVPTSIQLNNEGFKVEGTRVTDRMDLEVNTFNGDLGLVATDLQIAGTGLDLVLARTWHSRGTDASIFGNRWASTVGDDVYLEFLADGSVMLHRPAGGTAGFAKDGVNYLTPAGVDATLRFDDQGTATEPSDDIYELKAFTGSGAFVFDASSGKLIRRVDRNGNTLLYDYAGPGGALSSITDTQSRSLTFAYNAAGFVEKVTDPLGREVHYAYDGDGNLETYRDAAGKLTTYTYTVGDLTRITTPAGRRVDLVYDTTDRVSSITWPLAVGSPSTTFDYEFEKTVVTDANGHSTTYRYDPVGRTTSVVDALGNTTSMEYTSHSNVRRYTPGGGGTTSFGYSSVHALNSTKAPTGAEYTVRYDDSNHPHLPTTVRDPQGNELRYAYDSAGNRTRLTDDLPSQNRIDVTYHPRGGPATSTDPKGTSATTTYSYDAQGNLTGVTPPPPLGSVGPIDYDAVSRVESVTDGAGKTTSFGYDPLDRLTRVTYDDGSVLTREYDDDGNLVKETDALGVTTMAHDPMGRLVSRVTPDQAAVTYGYDKAGNLTSVTDASGTVSYGYNDVNLATSVTLPDGKTITLSYDASYNRTAVDFPDGGRQNYAYDDSNRVTRVTVIDGSTTVQRFDYSYANPATGNTDSGLRFSVTDLAGNKTSYSYDDLNRLEVARTTSPSGALVEEYAYTYDGAGNRLTHRITKPTPVGSVLHISTYNAANQLVTVSGENLTYDGNGNLTGSDLGAELTYDAGDRTTSIRPRADRGTPLRFVYRGHGQRERAAAGPIAEHVTTGGPLCVPVVGCQDDPDTAVATSEYEYTTLGLSAEETAGVRISYVRDPAGNVLAQRAAGTTQYLLTDGLGSVVQVNDQSAGTIATYRYDPFGAVAATSGEPAVTPLRFAGYYLDATGYYKVGHRYYDPVLGRWTQQDPIYDYFDPKLWNRYVYVGNDPVNFVDPSGLNAFSDFFTKTIPCAARGFARSVTAGFELLAGGLAVGEFFHAVEGMALKSVGDAVAKAALGTVGLVAGGFILYDVFQRSKKAGGCD